MKDQIQEILALAKRLGATYADVRYTKQMSRPLVMRNGQVDHFTVSEDKGYGIRVIVDGGWGFASTPSHDPKDLEVAVKRAISIAKASARCKIRDIELTPLTPVEDRKKVKVVQDPFKVSVDDMSALLRQCHDAMVQIPEIKVTSGMITMQNMEKTFASSEGSWIEQEITRTGANIEAYARSEGDVQRRSYANGRSAGYETIEMLDLVPRASKLAKEAAELLKAPECPKGRTTLILGGDIAQLQVHESCGHPIELDRVLGSEDTYAGKSFLTPDLYGKGYRYGSDVVNMTADATIEGGNGSFFYDDDGVPAQRTPIVEKGIFKNYLTSRETAGNFGLTSNGTNLAMNWANIPLIRMTNINLEPGDWSEEEMIRDTKEGVLVDTPKSWSLDDKRVNFHFGGEIAYEIKDGEIVRMVKNPAYTAITPEFWGSCDAVAGKEKGEWEVWGNTNCAKGEPVQVVHPGHGAAQVRFRNVKVGVGE